jgi:hypothetical protein
MQIRLRIEIERPGLNGSHHAVETGEGEPYQQINAKRPENRFGIRSFVAKDSAEDDHHNKYIEHKAKNYADNGKQSCVGLTRQHAFRNGRHC